MQGVLDWAREHLPAIEHFAHAAGVSGFAMLQDMRADEFQAVTDVKVGGLCRRMLVFHFC